MLAPSGRPVAGAAAMLGAGVQAVAVRALRRRMTTDMPMTHGRRRMTPAVLAPRRPGRGTAAGRVLAQGAFGTLDGAFSDAAVLPGIFAGAVLRRRRADLGGRRNRDGAQRARHEQQTDHERLRSPACAESALRRPAEA